MSKQIFINLPVSNAIRTMDFFLELGFTINLKYTTESAVCLVVNDGTYVLCIAENYFGNMLNAPLTEAQLHRKAFLMIVFESKIRVDAMVDKAVQSGAFEVGSSSKSADMYSRSFSDLDGHVWQVVWKEESF